MRVPNSWSARIDYAKICDYLLSPVHPIGRFKYAFFISLGYSRDSWRRFQADLRDHLMNPDVIATVRTAYGTKYVVGGNLAGPSGEAADVVAVWIVLDGETSPRLVTAYPGED